MEIKYIDRQTGELVVEKVYGGKALRFLYGKNGWGWWLKECISRNSLVSYFYGFWQKRFWTASKIKPFIQNYDVDASEFLTQDFRSFNDFFIRKLKPEARFIDLSPNISIIPADGRYWFYSKIPASFSFSVKGQSFNLKKLLNDEVLAEKYENGSLMIARLCPSDYHRFHFPCDGIPGIVRLINGYLYSVNPIAIKENINILTENKRTLTLIQTDQFGQLAYLEIGATNVGSIHQTFTPNKPVKKGEEKGYFSFGGSALILLFEPGKISFCSDLLEATQKGYEIRCLFGQNMGFNIA